ncbi:hypothetical protein A464_1855 [Salmonella bongori N268-08]|uniref:Uncharacterized protein n=1 Tax=Salmonella bongori N268-08 TaxID=1197719 RepID=S5N8Y3_SALBN|nr:hypothetical protein A464_1855 [Salmonella bongori N268-08]
MATGRLFFNRQENELISFNPLRMKSTQTVHFRQRNALQRRVI